MNVFNLLLAMFLKLLSARRARRYLKNAVKTTLTPSIQQKQLLVDVSVIYRADARTGIQRVVRSLLLQLIDTPPLGYTVRPVFATANNGYCYTRGNVLEDSKEVDLEIATRVNVVPGDLFLALDLAAHLLPRHQAQMLDWKLSGVKIHVVVYDLLPLQYPDWFNGKTTRNFRRWIRWVAVYADGAICISNSVKAEVNIWLNVQYGLPASALPTSTIVLGADIDSSAPSTGLPLDADFLLARMRNAPTVLMVGTLEPRKGYVQALAAFEHLWNQPNEAPLLVIVGRPGWKTEALQQTLRAHPQNGKRLIWLEDASDEFLSRLYCASQGILVTSWAEGFGLPLVEANYYNRPVLARDLAVFRELALPGVTFFSDENASGLANIIAEWLKSTLHEKVGSKNHHNHQKNTTWQNAALQLLAALELTVQPKHETKIGSAVNAPALETTV
jgi:glycosyltransferase involved in cell wall biosynthesis